jgi:hypothetical protein
MTETTAAPAAEPAKGIAWDDVVPHFGNVLKPPTKPARPSDGAIRMAQKSYDGFTHPETEEVLHVITHRFPTVEAADVAEDELKRAGSYTEPNSTVTVVRDPDGTGDNRIVRWRAGNKRGRKVE